MNDKTRKRMSNFFFALALICGIIVLCSRIFHFGGFGVLATFGIGIEVCAIIGLLFRAKDFIKWRGKLLAQGIQEARAEKYCSKCGKAISKDSAFCSGCGSKIEN